MKKVLFIVVLSVIFFIGVFLLTAVIHEYRPGPVEILRSEGKAELDKVGDEVTVLSWNIGYGGLGKEADFFMDGGVSSKPDNRGVVDKNFAGIMESLTGLEGDIRLFQEVDRNSNRSFNIDQFSMLKTVFGGFESYFAANFRVFMVPVPILDPIEKVHSGIVTLSKFSSEKAERYSLQSVDSWPEKLFHLKRCVLATRYRKKNGGELVIFNVHLSAYDDGKIRNEQMKKLRKIAVSEYEKGNSVIIGGDWNQRMPGVTKEQFGKYTTDEKYLVWAQKIDESSTPKDWKWIYDGKAPTVRSNESAYEKSVNFTTVIDGFLVSPDVEVLNVNTIDLGFEFSDHNPVIIKVRISGG